MAPKEILADIPRTIISRTRNYIGVQEPGGWSRLHQALAKVSVSEREALLKAPLASRDWFLTQGVPEIVVERLCLLSLSEGFDTLRDRQNSLSRSTLEHFLHHAIESTGLQRAVVMSLVSDITWALNTAVQITPFNAPEFLKQAPEQPALAFTVPFSYYENELENIRAHFEKWQSKGIPLSEDMIKQLHMLCAIGIPEAQYYMGAYRLEQANGKDALATAQRDSAAELLKKAAHAGSADAVALLGDYYYKKGIRESGWFSVGKSDWWGRALSCYTGYGAPPLNHMRRQNALHILNQEVRNFWTLRIFTVLSVLAFLITIIASIFVSPSNFLKMPFVIFSVILCIFFEVRRVKLPYESFMIPFFLLLLFIIWAALYLLLFRVIF